MNNDIETIITKEEELQPYEVKERKLITQPYDMSVQTVVEQIKNGDIFLEPPYQREYRWAKEKAARFIESLLLNIPIPNIFLAEEDDVTYTVIDGRQRLNTIKNFILPDSEKDRIILQGLQVRSDLNGKTFEELDKKDQGKLKKQYLRCSVILNDSDPQIKFDVFERLNTGSEKLQPQEIRNCTYRGNFNELIKKLAKNNKFKSMLKLNASNSRNMTDVEYVLRFFAYSLDINNYKGSVGEFLNNFMRNHRNLEEEQINNYQNLFEKTVDNLYMVLGNNAFKRYVPDKKNWYSVTNKALFDAEMVAFSKVDISNLSEEKLVNIQEEIKIKMSDEDFIKTIERTTNIVERVVKRINDITQILLSNGGIRIES